MNLVVQWFMNKHRVIYISVIMLTLFFKIKWTETLV